MKSASALTALLLIASASAFVPATRSIAYQTKSDSLAQVFLSDKAKEEAAEAVFMPPPETVESEGETEEQDDDVLEAVEKFGKGSAKVS